MRISPAREPATAVPSQVIATEVSELVVGESASRQVTPASSLLRIMPSSPTATMRERRRAMSLIAARGAGPTKTGACQVAPPSSVTSSRPPDAAAPYPEPSSATAVNVVASWPAGTTSCQDPPASRVTAMWPSSPQTARLVDPNAQAS